MFRQLIYLPLVIALCMPFARASEALPLCSGYTEEGTLLEPILNVIEIDPLVLEQYGTDLETVGRFISYKLGTLVADDYEHIISGILAAGAEFIKKDETFKIVFHNENENVSLNGHYIGHKNTLRIYNSLGYEDKCFGTFIHELTHYVILRLFKNLYRPYPISPITKKMFFEQYRREAIEKLEQLPQESVDDKGARALLLKSVDNKSYQNTQYDAEFIARVVEAISMGYLKDETLAEILEPTIQYWKREIEPSIIEILPDPLPQMRAQGQGPFNYFNEFEGDMFLAKHNKTLTPILANKWLLRKEADNALKLDLLNHEQNNESFYIMCLNYLRNGHLEQARTIMFEHYLVAYPWNGRVIGEFLYEQGYNSFAQELFDSHIEKAPSTKPLIAGFLKEKGDEEAAKKYL